MRLAVIETTPYGGLLHYAAHFGDALAERGHDVDLIVPRRNELIGRRGAARMRPVLTPTVNWRKQPKRDPVRRQLRRGMIALRLARSWARILWEVRRGRYDTVVVNCDVGLTLTATGALLLTRLPGGPRVTHIAHNARAFNRWGGEGMFVQRNTLRGAVYERMIQGVSVVMVHGEKTRAEYSESHPNVPVAVIPFGGDWSVFGAEPPPPADEERILFFGDWRKVKGLSNLMEAFDLLAERRPGVRLTIAGRPAPGDLDPEVVRLWARKHGDKVEVIDSYVPIEQVRDVFGRARVVVTPYVVGYQSGVLHLAMTHGRAAVASDVGDLGSAVVQGETGLVVPPGDVAALADALEKIVSDPALAQRMGEAARRRALDASGWSRVAESVEETITSMNGARRNGARRG